MFIRDICYNDLEEVYIAKSVILQKWNEIFMEIMSPFKTIWFFLFQSRYNGMATKNKQISFISFA